MSVPTISERLFERLCSDKHVGCKRIPESSSKFVKSADYQVSLGPISLITEVKQLDMNEEDRKLEKIWGKPDSPGAIVPSNRIQGLIADGYSQIKRSAEGKKPTMIVVYNNSGDWKS
jgi:hypothetical protein